MTASLTIGIVLYVIGAFLTALAIGFFRPNMDEGFVLLLSCFWLLFIIVMGAATIGDAIEEWAYENPGTAHRIGSIINRITIPFRPITLGRKIREWLDNRHKRQCN